MRRTKDLLWGKPGVVLLLLAGFVLIPSAASGQFGLDPCCAIISAGLQSISSLLRGVVATPLASIQQTEQQNTAFEQQVIYPASAIGNARGMATQLAALITQTRQIYRLSTTSATLPAPSQLERLLLSHNPQSMPQIGSSYVNVYGGVIPQQDAPQQVRDLVDSTDAEAQAALKKAIEIDALADVELATADQINQQIQTAAPGSVPILEAQAAAWNVRANAYTQSALAELMRIRSIDLANASSMVKAGADSTNVLRNATGGVLNQELR